jgi:hypothetical protein
MRRTPDTLTRLRQLAVRMPLALLAAVLASGADTATAPTKDAQNSFFENRIRPLLAEQCYQCHSDKARKLKGDLRLDSLAAMVQGGASKHPAIVPGKPDESLVIKAMRYTDEDLQMPPKARLDDRAIQDMVTWISMGAPFPESDEKPTKPEPRPVDTTDLVKAKSFWSFQPIVSPPAPAVAQAGWPANDIDRFVLARMEAQGVKPSPGADKRTLIRRATYDLTGLPPTPDEVDAFIADQSPGAFATVVDRLLASPRYGERWGRHWLDLVRYADTAGDSADYPIPQAYLYRNWVITALNRDLPYDEFVREQIAGDLLPAGDEAMRQEHLIATGFIALAKRFSVNPERDQHLTIDDTIDIMGRSLLGLTIGCARCHDHKFDPIPSSDYYALYGIFASTRYPFAGSEEDRRPHNLVPLASAAQIEAILAPKKDQLAAIDAEIAQIEAERSAARQASKEGTAAAAAKPGDPPTPTLTKRSEQELKNAQNDATRRRAALLEAVPYAFAVAEGTPADAHVQKRGDPDKQGELVHRRFLSILGGSPLPSAATGSGRLELAGWITSPGNPLTARVMANRIWQFHLGTPIVATPSDFGSRGRTPSNPALLDYLASRFIAGGWSLKAMHRMIMLSRTWQMSSLEDPGSMAHDAVNDTLWHFPRRRLEAEEIRDAILSVSGKLDLDIPLAHPFPPQRTWEFTQHSQFSAVYDSQHRSVYVMQQRIRRHPFFAIFDGADPGASTPQRMVSTSPLQALFLMNDPFVFVNAQAFAARLPANAKLRLKLDAAYRIALARHATASELDAGEAYIARFCALSAAGTSTPDAKAGAGAKPGTDATASHDAEAAPLANAAQDALASYLRALISSNEFLFID